MTQRFALLLALLDGEQALLERLLEAGMIPSEERELMPEHAELARLVNTLVHELDVNWEGVEVVLHLRAQLVATQRQVIELLRVLRARAS